MFRTCMVMNALYFEIFLWNIISAEWIDMPEFSDEKKVYRISSSKQDHFYKFAQENAGNQFPHESQDVAYKDLKVKYATNESLTDVFYDTRDAIDEPATHEHFDEETDFVINNEKYDEMTMSSIIEEEETNGGYFNESLMTNATGILNYLPVDILKSVHLTLKSQPTSSEGKIQFLRTFERTLMTEIESRLVQTITGGREKRGTEHYDHGYDNHDHPTAFPSIEGALMAISFLTFAVYLVRLVMLLFRNMNTSTNNNAGTVLLGRRKRSLDKFDDDTVKILSGIDNFSAAFQ